MVIAEALIKSNSFRLDDVKRNIASVDYPGITGNINFDTKGDLTAPAITLHTFINSRKSVVDVIRIK